MCGITRKLLSQGDQISIEQGQLVIRPKSGKLIPPKWMAENAPTICNQILEAAGVIAFQYEGYTVGCYGKYKAGGLTLQFTQALNREPAYLIFNADLVRDRNTRHGKKGSPLPEGQFRVGKRSAFVQFWESSGLELPRHLASFHDYMGKLKNVVFTGCYHEGEKLDKKTTQPLSLTHSQIEKTFSVDIFPDNSRIAPGELPDNSRIRMPDRESEENHTQRRFQEDSTTGGVNYGRKVKGSTGEGSNVIPLSTPINNPIRIEDEAVDEWLADYGLDDR